MNVLVLNGSPKGKYSITLQTVLYLEKNYPEHVFHFIHAAQDVRVLERDFSGVTEEVNWAELILIASPVYTYLIPSQFYHFIEIFKKQNVDLKDKYVSLITTSKHFFDNAAHDFIEDNMADLNAKYIKGFSPDMDDLKKEKGQKEARDFFDYLVYSVQNDIYEHHDSISYKAAHKKLTEVKDSFAHKGEKKIALVTDLKTEDRQLKAMIDRFITRVGYEVDFINLHEFAFGGGCTSCLNCVAKGECSYKDGFTDLLNKRIISCDAIVYAFAVQDHAMGYTFKVYDDRQYCNGHRIVTMNKPFGYLVSGDISREENLNMILRSRAEVGRNFLAGIASDESNPDQEIDDLAKKMIYALENNYQKPANFYGVGGTKIYRDMTWVMQGMVKMDHQFLKKNGIYDFPQREFGQIVLSYLVGMLLGNPKLRTKIGVRLFETMIAPYQKIIYDVK